MEENTKAEEMTVLKGKLLDDISKCHEAHFKSQQIGEPDLTVEEKRKIAEQILNKSSTLFLSRFGKFLSQDHLKFFRQSSFSQEEDYEVSFLLQEIENGFQKNKNEAVIKNRRLEALKQLALEGEYFSEEEMKRRNPLLYEQLVGRFLSEEEKQERMHLYNYNDEKLSQFILDKYDEGEAKKLLMRQQDMEDSVMEEEEDSSEEEPEKEKYNISQAMWGERNVDGPMELNDVEKKMFFEEFRSHMYSNFLQGKDNEFDYSKVDNNMEYDDLDTVERDEEEKYFDSEEATSSMREVAGEVDPLDLYMSQLEEEASDKELNKKMNSLTTS